MIKNGLKFDYCFRESIDCLLEFCDEVICCYIESEDETLAELNKIKERESRFKIIEKPLSEWNEQHGKYRLSYFQNVAAKELKTDYQFLLQGDEILKEDCYKAVRQAMAADQEAYMVTRINLWGDPMHQLNVPQNRKPCSTEVIRLSKTGYESYDDGESICAQCVDWFLSSIRIFHMGFVRDRKIHPLKIKEMQGNVFEMTPDAKLEGMDIFDGSKWFDPETDLKLIDEPLPKIIKSWADARM